MALKTSAKFIEILNTVDQILFCFCADDGSVRIWRSFEKDDVETELVTSFVALTDMVPLSKGGHSSGLWSKMIAASYKLM